MAEETYPCIENQEIPEFEGPKHCISDSNASVPDWTLKDETQPFLNQTNCQYSIVVDKAYINIADPSAGTIQYEAGGESLDERLAQYVYYGVDRLLNYYNKDASTEQRDFLITKALEFLAAREATSSGSSYQIP